jgi:hypothetical protein
LQGFKDEGGVIGDTQARSVGLFDKVYVLIGNALHQIPGVGF